MTKFIWKTRTQPSTRKAYDGYKKDWPYYYRFNSDKLFSNSIKNEEISRTRGYCWKQRRISWHPLKKKIKYERKEVKVESSFFVKEVDESVKPTSI